MKMITSVGWASLINVSIMMGNAHPTDYCVISNLFFQQIVCVVVENILNVGLCQTTG